MRKILFLLIFLICFLGGIAASHWWKINSATLSEDTLAFATPRQMPTFEVINHLGERVNKDDLLGDWSLMFFGFTHCPDICPNTLNALTQIQNELGKQQPKLILVSVDPMRDTPELLNTYINSFTQNIKAYTGELFQIQALTKALGVAYAYNAMPDGSYTVDHSAVIFIINSAGEYVGTYTKLLNTQEDINNLVSDFKKLRKRS